jgi:hypothetical protein
MIQESNSVVETAKCELFTALCGLVQAIIETLKPSTDSHGLSVVRGLGCSHKPFCGLILEGFIAEGHACRLTAAATNALCGLYVDGSLLIDDGANSTGAHGITVFAVVRADHVYH